MMQTELKKEKIELEAYKLIRSKTESGIYQKMSELSKIGYTPLTDEPIEGMTGFKWGVKNYDAIQEQQETVDPLELEIIEALHHAGNYLDETTAGLAYYKNHLLINTDYDIVNAKRQHDKLPPVKTAPEKKAWVELQLKQHVEKVNEAKRWFKYVESLAKKHRLPIRIPPWAEEAEKQDEEASKVVVEKVDHSNEPDEDIITPDMGMS